MIAFFFFEKKVDCTQNKILLLGYSYYYAKYSHTQLMFVTALARNQMMCTIIELKLVYTDNQKDLETLIFRLAVDNISPDTCGF